MRRIPLVSSLLLAAAAQAAVTIHFEQVGGDVVATASGSFNSWAGLAGPGSTNAAGGSDVSSAGTFLSMGASTSGWSAKSYMGYNGSGGSWTLKPTNFGTSNSNYYSSSTHTGATQFWLSSNGIYISQGYTLGTSLNNVSTWANTSLQALGLGDGIYTWAWTGDSVSVIVGTPVPEPSTYGLMLGGLALAAVALRRRKAA